MATHQGLLTRFTLLLLQQLQQLLKWTAVRKLKLLGLSPQFVYNCEQNISALFNNENYILAVNTD